MIQCKDRALRRNAPEDGRSRGIAARRVLSLEAKLARVGGLVVWFLEAAGRRVVAGFVN